MRTNHAQIKEATMNRRLRHLLTVALSMIVALVILAVVSVAPAQASAIRGCGTDYVVGGSSATVCVTTYYDSGYARYSVVTWSSGTGVSDVSLPSLKIRTSGGATLRSTSLSLPGASGSYTWNYSDAWGAHQMRATMYVDGHFGGDGYHSFGCDF